MPTSVVVEGALNSPGGRRWAFLPPEGCVKVLTVGKRLSNIGFQTSQKKT